MMSVLRGPLAAEASEAVWSGDYARLAEVRLVGQEGWLPSRLRVEEAALACVGVALQAAAALHQERGGRVSYVRLHRAQVAVAVRSERYFERNGRRAGASFAGLSRFWRASDGWVRTHANYPWHRAALLRVLSTTEDPARVAAALAERRAEEVEDDIFGAGGVAGAVRSVGSWQAHPQGRALAAEPLVSEEVVGEAPALRRDLGDLPASGVRVLDLTRVIAGPVCTRYMAALGADVVRLDPPHRLDMTRGSPADTLLGKRSALVDLSVPGGAATLQRLLADADVVVCGYRPGAVEKYGLDADTLAERHPGLVIVYLSAWGRSGPWAGRRGFDSVVQAPTGISDMEPGSGDEPGALPCQLLDHGTGYLAAAAALDGLARQARRGGTHVRRLSLARTALWLTSIPTRADVGPAPDDDPAPWMTTVASADGYVAAVRPPGAIDDRPLDWPDVVTGYGGDQPRWTSGPSRS